MIGLVLHYHARMIDYLADRFKRNRGCYATVTEAESGDLADVTQGLHSTGKRSSGSGRPTFQDVAGLAEIASNER